MSEQKQQSAALYRARFDPPGLHHVATIRALLEKFERVVVRPWGPHGRRAIDENIAPVFRARLVDQAFQRMDPRVIVDLSDIEDASTTASDVVEQTSPHLAGYRVSHVVEADSLYEDRKRLHAGARGVIVAAAGVAVPEGESWPVVRVASDVAGSVMRKRLYEGLEIDDLVPAEVAAAITRHGLYRGVPRSTTKLKLTQRPRLMLVVDERNEKAVRWSRRFQPYVVSEDPNLIMVFGGDGSMLHAIQQHWRRRVPFFGVNAGHLGFLLNDATGIVDDDDTFAGLWHELVVHHLPMLHVEMLSQQGGQGTGALQSGLTFNDAWVERATGQSAWIEVEVDGRVRMTKVVCDGCLVSTAAGSTAYARAMGAHPLLADTPAWLLVGSNVMEPAHWKTALLGPPSEVTLRVLNAGKRPVNGFLHGVPHGEVSELRARLSRAASVELAFLPEHDMAEKIQRVQFPT